MKQHHSIRGAVPSLAQTYSERAGQLAEEGKKVLSLHLGQPSSAAPKGAIEAAVKAAQTEILGYTSGAGIMPLRERIAQHYHTQYNVALDPSRVIVTIGASGALMLALIACFDPGAKIGIPYPVYPAYIQVIKMLGLKVVAIPTQFENHFQLTLDELSQSNEQLDGLIIASPSNPAGSIMPAEMLKKITEYCHQKGIQLLSDEIYHGLTYNDKMRVTTGLEYSHDTIVINSFSKYYSMPGWRLGWMVVPEDLAERIPQEARNLYLSPPAVSQHAALAAMDCQGELNEHLARYKQNRDLLLEALPQAGFNQFAAPDGAFYLYVHIKHLHHDAKQFCMDLLNETYITSMPGTAFDPHHGHHFIRFSYAGATQDIQEAIDRLIVWHNKNEKRL